MQRRAWLAFTVLGVVISPAHLSGQLRIPRSDTVALRRFVDTLATRMAKRTAEAGYPLPVTPRVLFDERALGDPRLQGDSSVPRFLAGGSFPLLNQVGIPTWDGVDASQRRQFEEFAAQLGPQRFFAIVWNWLAPAHELSHVIQGYWGSGYLAVRDDFDKAFEVEAFAIPIAFYREAGAVAELGEAATLFRQAVASLARYLPADTTGWSPASAPDAVRRCEVWIGGRAAGLPSAEVFAVRKLCPYRAILDLLTTSTGPDFNTLVRNIARANDPSLWPRTCDAAVDLLVRHPGLRREVDGSARDDLTPPYTTWRFGTAAGSLGLTPGDAALATSCGSAAAPPAEVLHRIVVRARERLHPR